MKTSRFERLSFLENAILVAIMASLTVFSFPMSAYAADDAESANKNSLVFEIKSFPLKIPNVKTISQYVTKSDEQPAAEVSKPAETAAPEAKTPAAKAKVVVASSTLKTTPPKAVNKVYMQEPDIRKYVCPKLGDKCNTFIAILKGENGTHECTRDNRGTNRNGSIDIGLAQINWSPRSTYTFEQLQDCKFNLDAALSMIERRGFQPWYAYTKGSYKKHLPAVMASAAALAESEISDEKVN